MSRRCLPFVTFVSFCSYLSYSPRLRVLACNFVVVANLAARVSLEGLVANLLPAAALLFLTPQLVADDWLPLFNGKDLAGWRANNDLDSFQVENGILRCHASGAYKAHLFYVGDRKDGFESFKNFELEATVRAEPNSNGGIFVHTDMSTRDAAKHLAKGYEVQLNSSAKEKQKTGSLYAIVPVDTSPVDETQWFVIRIVVQGKRITAAINGQPVLDYTEPDNVQRPPERAGRLFDPSGGAIALQAHDPQSTWYFKDIRINRLP